MWQQQIWQWPLKRSWQIVLVGFLLGSLTGFVGVGGGFLIVPLLLAVTSLTMSAAIATSLALILLQSSVGFIGHYQQLALQGQQLDLGLIVMLGALGALGSLLALLLTKHLPQALLRRIFALLLLVLGASLLWRHFL